MAATEVKEVIEGGLGDWNIGLTAAVGFINPLGAQLDAMIAANAAFRSELAVQLDASLALQASLALSVTDPFAYIKSALQAIIELQAALTAALALPPIGLSIGAELGAAASLSAALSAKLAALLSIDAAIAIKIPAIRAAADMAAALSVGGIVALSFDGLNDDPPNTLAEVGQLIKDKFAAGIGNTAAPPTDYSIAPTKRVSGVIVVTDLSPTFDAMGSIMVTA
jgi:hypothetical protein